MLATVVYTGRGLKVWGENEGENLLACSKGKDKKCRG